jgi:hypothetical protein
MTASKSSKKRKKKKSPEKLYNFEAKYKKELRYNKKLKFKCKLKKQTDQEYGKRIFYKIYLQTSQRERFLLTSGLKRDKHAFSLKVKKRLHKIIPPRPQIQIVVELYAYNKKLITYESEQITIELPHFRQQFKINDLTTFSKQVLPANPLVIWLNYDVSPLPAPVKVEAKFKLNNQKNTLTSQKFTFKIQNFTDQSQQKQYPFKISIPEKLQSNSKCLLISEFIQKGENEPLFTDKQKYHVYPAGKKVNFQEIKYKRSLMPNQVSYMIGRFQNHTQNKVKGKAKFYFFLSPKHKESCFSRKFRIQADNFEVISEDITLPPYIGGHSYWVMAKSKLKTSAGKFFIENLTDRRRAEIEQPQYIIQARALIRKKPIKPKQIIPIGVDFRTRVHNSRSQKKIVQVLLNYENVSEKIVHTIKVKKKNIVHSDFRWRVPKYYGTIRMKFRLFVADIPIHPDNVETTPLKFVISPF